MIPTWPPERKCSELVDFSYPRSRPSTLWRPWGRIINLPLNSWPSNMSQRYNRFSLSWVSPFQKRILLYLCLIKNALKVFFHKQRHCLPSWSNWASISEEAEELLAALKCQGHASSCQDFKTLMCAVSARAPQSTLTSSSSPLSIQFLLSFTSCISVLHLLKLVNQYWYLIINQSP